jgi:hypothetical protein
MTKERKGKLLPNLGSLNVKFSDFEWSPVAEMPKPTQTPAEPETHTVPPVVVPPAPATPALPRMKISPTPISAEELAKNLNGYYSELEKVPGWQELLAEENRKTKEARSEARRAARRKAAA